MFYLIHKKLQQMTARMHGTSFTMLVYDIFFVGSYKEFYITYIFDTFGQLVSYIPFSIITRYRKEMKVLFSTCIKHMNFTITNLTLSN